MLAAWTILGAAVGARGAASTTASSTASSVVVRRPPVVGWSMLEHAPSATTLVAFVISVRQSNLSKLKEQALNVNTPGQPQYGHFLLQQEIDRLTAPTPEAMATVTAWLADHGVSFTIERESIAARTTVRVASKLFETSFALYRRQGHSQALLRASADYSLPATVAAHVQAIFGLQGVPLPPRPPLDSRSSGPRVAKVARGPRVANVTPTVLAATYSIVKGARPSAASNRQAVVEFQRQYMNEMDLKTFFSREVPDARPGDGKVSRFVNVPYKEGHGVEALLDIQYIMGNTAGISTE